MCSALPAPFGVSRDGEPITEALLHDQAEYTGISYDDDPRVMFGLVPEFEEREAAVFSGTPWSDWLRIDVRERAACVAHYRMHMIVALHARDASNARDKRKRAREQASKGSGN